MRLLITQEGKLLNLDNINSFEFENGYIIAKFDNYSFKLLTVVFDSKSSADSWILNNLVKLINSDEKVIDLRKVKI